MALYSRLQIATHFPRIFRLTTESQFLPPSSPQHVIRTCATRINYSFIPSADSLCCPTRYISIGSMGPSSSRTQRGVITSPPDRSRVGWAFTGRPRNHRAAGHDSCGALQASRSCHHAVGNFTEQAWQVGVRKKERKTREDIARLLNCG